MPDAHFIQAELPPRMTDTIPVWPEESKVPRPDWDDDDPPFEKLSLCVDCCKDASLRRFVEANAEDGLACAGCIPGAGFARACAVDRRQDMMNLLAGLVRFHFDEFEYNSHWGAADSVEELLTRPNPILETTHTLFNDRSDPRRAQELLYWLFSDNPYPDPGISVYAGFDADGGRHLARSIQQTRHSIVPSLRARLDKENPFDVESAVFSLIDRIGARVATKVEVGARFFRARTGVAGRYQEIDGGWKPKIRQKPFADDKIGAPPPPKATSGRLNRTGIAFLYLASDAATAAAEIRPHPGHRVSIGQFECVDALRIASFNTDIAEFTGTEADLDLFHFIHTTNILMSEPIVPEAVARYSVTQLIADCLRQRGYDGVAYRSSVGDGDNLCVFTPAAFRYVESSGEVLAVQTLKYELDAVPTMTADDADYHFVEQT